MKKTIIFILFLFVLTSCNQSNYLGFEEVKGYDNNIEINKQELEKISEEFEKINNLSSNIIEENNEEKTRKQDNLNEGKSKQEQIKKEKKSKKQVQKKYDKKEKKQEEKDGKIIIEKIVRLGDIYKFGPKSLHINSRGPDVRKVQMLLRDLGFYHRRITGYYDVYTLQAMRKALIVKCGWPRNNAGTFGKQPRPCILNLRIKKREVIDVKQKLEEKRRLERKKQEELEKKRQLEEEKRKNQEEEAKKKAEEERKKQEELERQKQVEENKKIFEDINNLEINKQNLVKAGEELKKLGQKKLEEKNNSSQSSDLEEKEQVSKEEKVEENSLKQEELEKQKELEFQNFLKAHTIEGKTSIKEWKISLERQKKEAQKKLEIMLKKREDEKLRLELARKKAEQKRLEEEKRRKAKKAQEELIKKRKLELKKARKAEQERQKKLEEQRKKQEELRKQQEKEKNSFNNIQTLSREERLKQKVEEYKKQKEKEAGVYDDSGLGNSPLEIKIKEERKIIAELEQRLEYHKKFLEEYEKKLREQQASGDIFSLSPEEIKLIEEYRKTHKKTNVSNSYSSLKKEVRYTGESYIPTKGFFEKKNGIITCDSNKKLAGVSYSTFKELGDNYARDIAKVYYGCSIIKSGNVNDFKLVKYGFVKDDNNVYYRGKKMPMVESPRTFWVDSKGNFKIAYDENNVYLFDAFGIRRVLKNTSYEDVEYLDKTYFKAKNNIILIYCDSKQCHFNDLKGVDYYSFEALGFGFAKDKNGVYYKGNKIPNIDIYTAEALSYTKIKDKNGTYKLYNGKFVKIK